MRLRERLALRIATWGTSNRPLLPDRAEMAYFAADDVLFYIWDRLATETDPDERGRLLRAAGGVEYARFVAYTPAFGPDPNPDEGGRDMAESLERASRLLNILAVVEHSVASGEPLPAWPQVAPAVREVACRMVRTPGLRERHALLADFCRAAMPVDGGQAVESVANIPAPDCPPLRPYVPLVERATATTV